MKKVAKTLMRVGLVSTSVLMAVVLTAGEITAENRLAISTNLHQPTYEIIQKEGSENLDTQYYKSKYSNLADLVKDGKQLTEDIVAEGAVLLENNGALPLKANEKKVSLIGVTAELLSYGGRGSAHTSKPIPPTTLAEGMEGAGLSVNKALKDYYKKVCWDGRYKPQRGGESASSSWEISYDTLKEEIPEFEASLEANPVVIYTIPRVGGEGRDLNHEALLRPDADEKTREKAQKGTLKLTDNEKSILAGLAKLKTDGKIKKIIVLMNSTNEIQRDQFLDEYKIDSMLWTGHVGVQGAAAIGKLLTGAVNPSGHLVDTFYYDHMDNPVEKNNPSKAYLNKSEYDEFNNIFKPTWGGDKYGHYYAYQEGIYVGYRYSETRYTDVVNKVSNAGEFDYAKTIYRPFGYGQSYTTFEYSNFSLNTSSDPTKFTVSVDVKNTGDVAGKDAVQVYLQKPYGDFEKQREIEVPAVELVGYAKTKMIQPGKSITVSMDIDKESLRTYDRKVDKTYIVAGGTYGLAVGQDAHDAANNLLALNGKKVADGMTSEGNAKLATSFTVKYDKDSYSIADTGNRITNLFDNVDMNSYEFKDDETKDIHNKVEFMTRSNWNKELKAELKITTGMLEDMKKQMTSEFLKDEQNPEDTYPTYGEAVAEGEVHPIQLISLFKDDDGNLIEKDDPIWDEFLDQLTWTETATLVTSGMRLTAQLDSIGKPKTVDHNGPTGLTEAYDANPHGLASTSDDPLKKTAAPYYPSIPVVAATFSHEIASRFGDMIGEDALWAGYNGFYGVGLNTHRSAFAGRQFEYWSEDPFLAGSMAAIQVQEMQKHGCMAYIKHFALNDQENNRNNVHIWSNEQALREISLRPYEIAVRKGGAMSAMASFTRIGAQQCPGCKELLTDYLRGELGMKGLVVTDMFMIGYSESMIPAFIQAGCDIPDGNKSPTILDAYQEGYPTLAKAMRESAKRVCYHTVRSNAMNGIAAGSYIRQITPPWEKAMISVKAISIVLFTGMVGWLAVAIVLENKSKFLKK